MRRSAFPPPEPSVTNSFHPLRNFSLVRTSIVSKRSQHDFEGERESEMLLDELRTSTAGAQRDTVFDDSGAGSYRLAQEIASAVPAGLISRFEEHPDRLQLRIAPSDGWKLRRIILSRESLERLARDPQRDVKVEYLKRELTLAATTRRIWSYPRTLALR